MIRRSWNKSQFLFIEPPLTFVTIVIIQLFLDSMDKGIGRQEKEMCAWKMGRLSVLIKWGITSNVSSGEHGDIAAHRITMNQVHIWVYINNSDCK